MSNEMIQLLLLGGIAVFLILRLKNVLGTREGFEKPTLPVPGTSERDASNRQRFEVIDGGRDRDITDHVDEDSEAAKALTAIKKIEPNMNVTEFLSGARGAYEMILMAFERSEIDEIKDFLAAEVYEAFDYVIEDRKKKGLLVEASFVGVRELSLQDAEFDEETKEAELTVRFIGELTSVVRDSAGDIVEGNPNEIKRQRDVWTFARTIGSDDPNWQLVATGE